MADRVLLAHLQRAVDVAEPAAVLLQLGHLVAVALAQGIGAVRQFVAEFRFAQGRLELELLPQLGDALHVHGHQNQVADGEGGVHRQQGQEGAAQHEFQPHGQALHQLLEGRVDEKDHDVGQHAPGEGHPQAHPALEVETELGVIPVFHVGGDLQHPAHQVLPRGHDHYGHPVEKDQVPLQRREEQDHQGDAAAVDGADWAVEEPAGHQAALHDGAVTGLHHPAQEGVQDKVEEQLGKRDAHEAQRCSLPSSSASSVPSRPL